ncbi:Ivy family c-type lysozyme inhibitor [Methyloceanibacter stevinii]|nr:Ivy family c-type lysozyme inhibitor [Methyloceanibacter stevinii]
MRLSFLLALFLSLSSPALAQEAAAPAGPVLGDLLKNPAYFNSWQAIAGGKEAPDWLKEYTQTLDGPPVPSIPVAIDNQTYSLAFTCKPNECEQFQIFVLFAPDGSKAWALMGSPLTGVNWLGEPDERIRAAITAALQK